MLWFVKTPASFGINDKAAFEKETRLDDNVMKTAQAWAADVRHTQRIGDFTHWKNHDQFEKAFARVLRDLKA